MWMRSIGLFAAASMLQMPTAAPETAIGSGEPATLVLDNVTLIDGVSPRARSSVAVTVRSGRIESVGPAGGPHPENARIIDLEGRWLLPGLIDAHVHLRDLDSARTALLAGVTTARSMGVDHFADVGLAALHRGGGADVPDVIAAGYHVRRRLAGAFFLDFPDLLALRTGLNGTSAVQDAVRANIRRGAQVIKVMATERAGIAEADMRQRVLSDEELRAAVQEATRAGLGVAAHAHTDDGARAAVIAGARTIEHGTLVTEGTLRLMRDRGACFIPTLSFWADMLDPGGEYDDVALALRARAMQPYARRAVALADRLGVTIAAGSDMRYDRSSPYRLADELVELARSGMTPMAAIKAGTSSAAACLGVSHRTGAVRVGLEADLIVVDADPLRDLSSLHEPSLIINDGIIALARR